MFAPWKIEVGPLLRGRALKHKELQEGLKRKNDISKSMSIPYLPSEIKK